MIETRHRSRGDRIPLESRERVALARGRRSDPRLQLPAPYRRQRHRDVAGRHVRRGHDRPGAWMGQPLRVQRGPGVPAVPRLGRRPGRLQGAPRPVPRDGEPPRRRRHARPVRRLCLLRQGALPGSPRRAGARRAQQRVGAEPRARAGDRPLGLAGPGAVRQGRGRRLRRGRPRLLLGPLQRAR